MNLSSGRKLQAAEGQAAQDDHRGRGWLSPVGSGHGGGRSVLGPSANLTLSITSAIAKSSLPALVAIGEYGDPYRWINQFPGIEEMRVQLPRIERTQSLGQRVTFVNLILRTLLVKGNRA